MEMLFDNYTLGLLLFAISMVATPGPANMILLSAGSQFGFKKSVPFVIGIILLLILLMTFPEIIIILENL